MTNQVLLEKIAQYKRKFYFNLVLRGVLLLAIVVLWTFVLMSALEYFGQFDTTIRTVLFFSFLSLSGYGIFVWLGQPILRMLKILQPLNDFQAAAKIGDHFPEIDDKLLNYLQLYKASEQSALLQASLDQRADALKDFDFAKAVDLRENNKYLKYLLPIFFVILGILVFVPELFKEGATRLLNFSTKYEAQAPFRFVLLNQEKTAFRNDDYQISVRLEGSAIPNSVVLVTENNRRIKMTRVEGSQYVFTLNKIQKNTDFYFEAAGFHSNTHTVEVFSRPLLNNFSAYLEYPAYIGKPNERIANTGNMLLPQGTKVTWQFNASETHQLSVDFADPAEQVDAQLKGQAFELSKKLMRSTNYQINLKNKHSENKEPIAYFINVIADQYPQISLKQYQDTTLYNFILLAGSISDDYGLRTLNLRYRKIRKDGKGKESANFLTQKLNMNPALNSQSFFEQIAVDQFELKDDQALEYFLEVWDNDGVNGSKSARTHVFQFAMPDAKQISDAISNASSNTEQQLEKSIEQVKELNKQIKDLDNKLKGKKQLSWQDKKELEDLIKKNEAMKSQLEQLKQENQQLNEKLDRFTERDSAIAEKAKLLEELMDNVLDEKTQELFKKLEELLQKEKNTDAFRDVLDQLQFKEDNVEKQLDRALEMFKQLQFETKLDEIIKQMDQLANEQQELADQTKDAKNKDLEDLKDKQDQLNQKFDQLQDEMKKLEEMNQELKNQKDMDDFSDDQKQIDQKQNDASEQLEQKNQKKAAENQKNAADKMKQMAQKMSNMKQSSEMEQMQEDYNALRQILENLLTISFDQEGLMLDFKTVRQSEPRFVTLGQKQLKLKDDAKIAQDSLLALAERVFQIKSFVTEEVAQMNRSIDKSLDAIKNRVSNSMITANQQAAMTSVNNLALMLSDVLSQMQQQMSGDMDGQQNNQKQNSPGNMPGLSEMQKQLNQQIQDLMKSGKSGAELSKELAKLAAQQEMIRNALKNQGKDQKDGKQGGGVDPATLKEMEKTEEDLINKRLTQEMITRQKEILTRLLESEKAQRERDLDKDREAKTGKKNEQQVPQDFSEYFKLKEKQIELLKTIPTTLTPYYKKEVDDYFNKLKK